MRFSYLLILLCFVLVIPKSYSETLPTAKEIVAAADAVRNPDKPFSLSNLLIEYREGKEQNRMNLLIYAKSEKDGGQYRNLIRFAEPARDAGKLMLKQGNVLWFYDPASKSAVRISPQQRLLGQASNGDVMTVNFHLDYEPTLEGEETITDADKKSRLCHKLNMKAKNESVTYFRIEYWVDKTNSQPVKGKFYSDSDRLMKIAYYRGYQEQLGRLRPTEVIIIDGLDNKLVTKMNTADYRFREIPEEWFQKDYLPRFTGE